MAEVHLEIGGRRYALACRDGEEAHFHDLAGIIDGKMAQAAQAVGGLNEVRQFLFASLLLADELEEARRARSAAPRPAAPAPTPAPPAQPMLDPAIIGALEHLAQRLEALAGSADPGVEGAPPTP
ncbi:cell division protein ZapA [Sphingomonas laterariae]|uniref:Cell division protein ZapA n=1 Tax=Edaphosphingomonas laterariae TaxID=861865 RepID=A0A239DZX4_9SPHN|nr:cell division protein ZapA [Sphingomonas laterariae]SNS37194.1 cell division protein ZapA [Sphingomonas laterariae]